MSWIDPKYDALRGTHCWYCDRVYGKHKSLIHIPGTRLFKTKDHIIPRMLGGKNTPRNYVGACNDCNTLKAALSLKEFAQHLDQLHQTKDRGTHPLYPYFQLMMDRAWKLYNKTNTMHREHVKSRLTL